MKSVSFSKRKIAAASTVFCYLLSFALNFLVFITPVHHNRGAHLGLHPGWLSFTLSLLLLISIFFWEWFSKRSAVSTYIRLGLFLLGTFTAVGYALPYFGSLNCESYIIGIGILVFHMPFYGLSALFDAGAYPEPAYDVTYIHEDRFALFILIVFVVLLVYHILWMICVKNRRRKLCEKT